MPANIANTIMVVDDTPKNLTLLTAILERRKYRVITATDGVEALKIMYDDMPDLILLDIMMPKMDGFEVCRQLKEDQRSADIPVIFISALDDTQDIIRAFDVGGVDYVTKPFKSREVLKRVESHLTLLRQRRQLQAIRAEERAQFERINAMREQFIRSAT
ncbi:MAG: response regulator, partial [Aggregatilineales bacterium]